QLAQDNFPARQVGRQEEIEPPAFLLLGDGAGRERRRQEEANKDLHGEEGDEKHPRESRHLGRARLIVEEELLQVVGAIAERGGVQEQEEQKQNDRIAAAQEELPALAAQAQQLEEEHRAEELRPGLPQHECAQEQEQRPHEQLLPRRPAASLPGQQRRQENTGDGHERATVLGGEEGRQMLTPDRQNGR